MHMKILYNQRQVELLESGYEDSRIFEDAEDSDDELFEDAIGETPSRNMDFVTNHSPRVRKERVIEHPAKTNPHREEYRYCHPMQPRGKGNGVTTFSEIKDTLNNNFSPDDVGLEVQSYEFSLTPEIRENILKRCIVESEESLSDMKLVMAFHAGPGLVPDDVSTLENVKQYKVVIFDTAKQLFLLRTSHNKEHCRDTGYLKPIDVHSHDPEWCVDRSTFLARKHVWVRMREIINSIV